MGGTYRIGLVIFDLDGTITRPYLDFDRMRRALGVIEPGVLVLDFILSLPPDQRERALAVVDEFEKEAADKARMQDGADAVIAHLRRRGVKTAVLTRNSHKSVTAVLDKFGIEVDEIIHRDSPYPPKPDPGAIRDMLSRYGLSREQAVIVGDFRIDIEAGKQAGIRTVLFGDGAELEGVGEPDARVGKLGRLLDLIEKWEEEGQQD